eukprot:scaffold5999_cov149-Amphora_coffeaeformis.AAC.7
MQKGVREGNNRCIIRMGSKSSAPHFCGIFPTQIARRPESDTQGRTAGLTKKKKKLIDKVNDFDVREMVDAPLSVSRLTSPFVEVVKSRRGPLIHEYLVTPPPVLIFQQQRGREAKKRRRARR